MTGRRGEESAGHGKAVPRDMQDQQAGTTPEYGPQGPGNPRAPKGTENAGNTEDAEDVSGTAGTGEPQGDEDEPPD